MPAAALLGDATSSGLTPARCVALPADLEHRLYVQLLPMLLHLDQAALAFLQHFFASDSSGSEDGSGSSLQPVEAHASPGGAEASASANLRWLALSARFGHRDICSAALVCGACSAHYLAELALHPFGRHTQRTLFVVHQPSCRPRALFPAVRSAAIRAYHQLPATPCRPGCAQ